MIAVEDAQRAQGKQAEMEGKRTKRDHWIYHNFILLVV